MQIRGADKRRPLMLANLLTMLLCCNAGFALASAAKVDAIVSILS